MNGAQASPVAGAERSEVMPMVSYRANAEPVLREIHEVTALGAQYWERSDRYAPGGRRRLAKQVRNGPT